MNVTHEAGDVTPAIGEAVLCVPQRLSHLMRTLDGKTMADLPEFSNNYGQPYLSAFASDMPHWGWGVMVIRDGVFHRGPAQWDSSD